MTTQADVQEAMKRLSELLDRVQRGEEVVIVSAGEPCARLVPFYPTGTRQAGAFRGRISGVPLASAGCGDDSWG